MILNYWPIALAFFVVTAYALLTRNRPVTNWAISCRRMKEYGAVHPCPRELHEQLKRIPAGSPLHYTQATIPVTLSFRGGAKSQLGMAFLMSEDYMCLVWAGERPRFDGWLSKAFSYFLWPGLRARLNSDSFFIARKDGFVKSVAVVSD